MEFNLFQDIISADRMKRYVNACNGDKRKAMTLYRYNLELSSEMLKIISCFEVALRNRIGKILESFYGYDWLRDSCLPGGIFDSPRTLCTQKIVSKAYQRLVTLGAYSSTQLMAEMEFGVWKYMYSGPQYMATGQKLLGVFPNKPKSSPGLQIDNRHIFNELNHINQIRNRIAHHEPICFQAHCPVKSVTYAQQEYQRIQKLFTWMEIDSKSLLYGIDRANIVSRKIIGL